MYAKQSDVCVRGWREKTVLKVEGGREAEKVDKWWEPSIVVKFSYGRYGQIIE